MIGKMLSTTLLALSGTAAAVNLFVADYSGQVTSLSLSGNNSHYTLKKTYANGACAPNPSWLTIEPDRGLLFCLNEGLETPGGSLSSFTINDNGSLTHVQNTTTINGPVSGAIYGEPAGQCGIALAHYGGSAVSSWKLGAKGKFSQLQNIPYTLSKPGPNPDSQDAPHPHEAIIDPTGQYVVVPDLGADLIRVFSWNQTNLKLKALKPLQAASGSGPRHAAFYNPSGTAGGTTYFYLVAELAATVTSYSVSYLPNNGGLSFTKLSSQPTTGRHNLTRKNAPAEVQVSPDNRFLVISNRNDSSFTVPRHDKNVPSDSISTFALSDDGSLDFHQLWPAGGSFPRQFSMNAIGNLVAVGLQNDNETVILKRDVDSGLIGEPVASIKLGGAVTCVVWDE